MGYYTDKDRNRKSKQNGRKIFFAIVGIFIGVFVVNLWYQSSQDKQSDIAPDRSLALERENPPIRTEQMNVDVTTQITDVVDTVSDAVVGITNIQTNNDYWMDEEAAEAGTGSGVIYKEDGDYAYIVTNHHVVEDADSLEVVLNNETNLDAELLGSDLFTDLAVVRVDASQVDGPIDWGASEKLKVGEPVIAIGNPLGHMFAGSVTQGIISGKQRTIPQDFNQDGRPDWQAEVLQTDAAINPGNSGGALINMQGQLIGINSMKISQEIAQGIGFAIPIDTARPIIDELERTGVVRRPSLGVEIYSLEEVPQKEWEATLHLPDGINEGVYIWRVNAFSPADGAGLKRLDVITEFAGQKVHDILKLRKILYEEKKIGDEVDIVYYRDGEKRQTSLTLEEQQ